MKKLKLNVLAESNLSKLEMNQVRGGNFCSCGCAYEGQAGGSSSQDNCNANYAGNKSSPGVVPKIIKFDRVIINP